MMLFRKKGGRRKEVTFRWNEKVLEIVESFDYLGYTLKGNNSDTDNIWNIKGKANDTIERIWSIAERKFKDAWDLKMRLFEVMVKGVILYRAENWRWKEWKEIEQIKMKYVRWTLKLKRTTPWHTIRKDTEIRKVALEAAARAMEFEEKLSRAKEGTLKRMVWERACKDEEDKWSRKERKASWNETESFWRAREHP